MVATAEKHAEIVADALKHYAERGVFRGFGAQGKRSGKYHYRIRWHYESDITLTFDPKTKTLRFPALFPDVGSHAGMYDALRGYVKRRKSDALPDHRRLDTERIDVRLVNRGGVVSLSVKSLDGDIEYAVRKLVHLVHEIFIDFLRDGQYYEYLVEAFGAEADPM